MEWNLEELEIIIYSVGNMMSIQKDPDFKQRMRELLDKLCELRDSLQEEEL